MHCISSDASLGHFKQSNKLMHKECKEHIKEVHGQQVCGGGVQVAALEIQAQQLQTILNKRTHDTRAATLVSDDVSSQVCLRNSLSGICFAVLWTAWMEVTVVVLTSKV